MAHNRMTIEIVGIEKKMPFEEFLRELQSILAALQKTETEISGLEKSTLRFDLIDLHHSNPTIELEAASPPQYRDFSGRTIQKFLITVNEIGRGRVPKWMDIEALETYKELATSVGKDIQHIVLKNSKRAADITPQYRDRIAKIIGPNQNEVGSVVGSLEMLSIHKGMRFALYPRIGPKRIVCNFEDRWLPTVQSAIGRTVEAFGILKFKARSQFPHEMDVEDLEVRPLKSERQSLSELKAVADAAMEEKPDDFVLALDNDW